MSRTFEFTIEGQYYAAHGSTGLPVIKSYRGIFKLLSLEGALSVIVKNLLDPYLTKNYEDYSKFRTHRIVALQTTGRKPDPTVLQLAFDDMSVEELTDFCILKHIFIDPHKHKDLDKCRIEVAKIYQNRTDQKKLDEKSGKAAEDKEIDELLRLNNIPKLDPNTPNINMQRSGAALKNAGDGRTIERVGSEALGLKHAHSTQASTDIPVLNAPVELGSTDAVMEEEPVDNDPALTAKAFEKAAQKNAAPVPDDIFA